MSVRWRCDSCGRDIESVEDGWVEWLTERDSNKGYGMRLVHHDEKCMYDERLRVFPK